jgi:hypothetical protein
VGETGPRPDLRVEWAPTTAEEMRHELAERLQRERERFREEAGLRAAETEGEDHDNDNGNGDEEEEERQRKRELQELRELDKLERRFRLAEALEGDIGAATTAVALRATPDAVAPPPAYRSHPYRAHQEARGGAAAPQDDHDHHDHDHDHRELHLNPKQTAAYVEERIAHAAHQVDQGAREADSAPSFRTAPLTAKGHSDNGNNNSVDDDVDAAEAEANADRSHPTAAPVKLAILGDVAQTKPALDTLDWLNDHGDDVTAVLLVGDIAYANGVHDVSGALGALSWHDTYFFLLSFFFQPDFT